MNKVAQIPFKDYKTSVYEALDHIEAAEIFKKQKKIIIKPNLVSNSKPPVTTDAGLVAALINYIRKYSRAKIIVAEGSGGCDTEKCFEGLGYKELQAEGVSLVDLDSEKSIIKLSKDLPLLKEAYIPSIIMDGFMISAASLKEHLITSVTLGIKNMVGILPRKHYQGFWVFRKSKVHRYNIHQAVADVCFYRPIDLTLIDGSVGLEKGHLFGRPYDPPKGMIIAGFDILETDVAGARLLGKNPKKVKHLRCYKNNLEQAKQRG